MEQPESWKGELARSSPSLERALTCLGRELERWLTSRRVLFRFFSVVWLALLTSAFLAYFSTFSDAARTGSPRGIVDFLVDDAYYYLGVARSLALGLGPTFDGQTWTNGFQPLWQLVLAVFVDLAAGDATTTVVRTVWFVGLLVGLAVVHAARRFAPGYRAIAVIALLQTVAAYNRVFLHGMEPVLLLFFVPFLAGLRFEARPRHPVLFGLAFFALFLVRLDAGALFLAYLVLLVGARRALPADHGAAVATFAILAALYAAINYAVFGLALPVSGLHKSVGVAVGPNFEVVGDLLGAFALPSVALVAAITLRWLAGGAKLRFSRSLAVVGLAGAIQAVYYGLFSTWPIWSWYKWPAALWNFFAVLELLCALREFRIDGVPRSSWRSARVVALGCLASTLGLVLPAGAKLAHNAERRATEPSFNKQSLDMIDDFFAHADSGIVVMGDRAAGLGFFLPERFAFFQAEGLVEDASFLEARRAGTAWSHIDRLSPRFFVVDRERYMQDLETRTIGIPEPAMPLSTRTGVELVCFPKSALLYDDVRYDGRNTRYAFDYARRCACPATLLEELRALGAYRGALHRFSWPTRG